MEIYCPHLMIFDLSENIKTSLLQISEEPKQKFLLYNPYQQWGSSIWDEEPEKG